MNYEPTSHSSPTGLPGESRPGIAAATAGGAARRTPLARSGRRATVGRLAWRLPVAAGLALALTAAAAPAGRAASGTAAPAGYTASRTAASPGRTAAAAPLGRTAAAAPLGRTASRTTPPATPSAQRTAAPGGKTAQQAGSRQVPVGGPQLGSRGIVVNDPATGHHRHLPYVAASAYVVADAGTGQVLAAKDPHGWYRPASTLKVLTAVTLMPLLNPEATVVASRRAATVEPSKVGLVQGDSYRVSDLFKALLMISANDAAISLAQATGSFERGVALMNAQAHHLQAYDTVAKRPNGLDARGQHVSAYDEALFARQALYLPALMHDEALRVARFPRRPHHKPVKLFNQNTMLDTFPGDLGGKIGWTTPAKATFIGWARQHGHTLIVTILHCTPLTEMTYAARLLRWGFAADGTVKPVGELVRPLPRTAAKPRQAAKPSHRPVAPRAALRAASPPVPGVPLAAGLGTLALAVATGVAVALATRRGRRAGNPPAR
jgi:serine-type D-Ala-D-Ala carboxypeptidase (penicillin-binding protein 5/6)